MRRARDQENPTPTFPGYSQIAEIGGGGFSTVYRATEEATGRSVALKVLRVGGRAPQVLEAFDREVRALGALSSHPNIVTLYRTLTTADGRPVLVMELCRGSMAQRIRTEGALGAQEAVAVGIKMAGALETAHRSGLLHRDLKPQNVLITHYAEPALADFGVAALQASAQATEGIFGFTTLHAPPEVLEGQHLSPATDVYGLASTLYQLLAGQAPFAAYEGEAPASVILRILRDPVTPLRANAAVPIALSDLLNAALSKDPRARPESALALAEALQRVERVEGWAATSAAVWGQTLSPSRSLAPPSVPADESTPATPASARPAGPNTGRPARAFQPPVPLPASTLDRAQPTSPVQAANPLETAMSAIPVKRAKPTDDAVPPPEPWPGAPQPGLTAPDPAAAQDPGPTHRPIDLARRGPGVVAPVQGGRRVLPAQPLNPLPSLTPAPPPPNGGPPAAVGIPPERPRYVDPPTLPPVASPAPPPDRLAPSPQDRPTLWRPVLPPAPQALGPSGPGRPAPARPAPGSGPPAAPLSPAAAIDRGPDAAAWSGVTPTPTPTPQIPRQPGRVATYEETLAPAGLAAALRRRAPQGEPLPPASGSRSKVVLTCAVALVAVVAAVVALLVTGVI